MSKYSYANIKNSNNLSKNMKERGGVENWDGNTDTVFPYHIHHVYNTWHQSKYLFLILINMANKFRTCDSANFPLITASTDLP